MDSKKESEPETGTIVCSRPCLKPAVGCDIHASFFYTHAYVLLVVHPFQSSVSAKVGKQIPSPSLPPPPYLCIQVAFYNKNTFFPFCDDMGAS